MTATTHRCSRRFVIGRLFVHVGLQSDQELRCAPVPPPSTIYPTQRACCAIAHCVMILLKVLKLPLASPSIASHVNTRVERSTSAAGLISARSSCPAGPCRFSYAALDGPGEAANLSGPLISAARTRQQRTAERETSQHFNHLNQLAQTGLTTRRVLRNKIDHTLSDKNCRHLLVSRRTPREGHFFTWNRAIRHHRYAVNPLGMPQETIL